MSSSFNNCVRLTDKDKRKFIPEVVWLVLADSGRAKKYKDIIKLDGGTVGIAHFASGGLGGLYQKMGDALIQKYFGKTMTVQKMIDNYSSKCLPEAYAGKGQNDDGWGCYSGGHNPLGIDWKNGMTSFLNDAANNQIQDEAVYTARVGAINDAVKNGWNLPFQWAVAIGISNSKGNGGFTSLAKRNGWDAEKTLNAYTSEKVSGHRNKRAELIRKFYPLCTDTPKENTQQVQNNTQQQQPNNQTKPEVKPQQNQNQGTPIPQEKKVDDKQDVPKKSTGTSTTISRLFSNTLKPQDIELIFKSTNKANQQIIAQTLGFSPVLFYNGAMIDTKDIVKFKLFHEGLVPKIECMINDTYGMFKGPGKPADDTKISLFINSRSKILAPIRIDFKINYFKSITSTKYSVHALMDIPKLYTKFFASVPSSSSLLALQAIAKDCGLGFVTNIQETTDTQNWINTGLTYREFIRKIVDKSYISDQSFQVCYIDYFYNLCFVDLTKEFRRNIDEDIAVSCMGFDKLTSGTGQTEIDDQIIPMILTTERNSNMNVNFIEKFKIINNSTSVSISQGYRSEVKYLDFAKKELVYFKIESQTDASKISQPFKANSGDNKFYEENTKSEFVGKIDSYEDGGNAHINQAFAFITNKRNLLELIRFTAVAMLPNYNFNLYPYRKVPIQVIKGAPTPDGPGFDPSLTGNWIILTQEFHWTDGKVSMYLTVAKRSVELPTDELPKEPIKKVDQNNKKTEKNELVPGSAGAPTPTEKKVSKVEPTGDVILDENRNRVFGASVETGGASYLTVNQKYPRSKSWRGTQPVVVAPANPPTFTVNLSSQKQVAYEQVFISDQTYIQEAEKLINKLSTGTSAQSLARKLLILYSAFAISKSEQGASGGFRGFNNNISGVESSGFKVYSQDDVVGKVQATEGGTRKRKFYYAFASVSSGLIPLISSIMNRNMWEVSTKIPITSDYQKNAGGEWAWRYFRDWNGYGGRTFPQYQSGEKDDSWLITSGIDKYRSSVQIVNKYTTFK